MKPPPPSRPVSPTARALAWFGGLKLRPLVWLAPSVVTGCVLGAHGAAWLRIATPDATCDNIALWSPLPFFLAAAWLAWRWRERKPLLSRLALAAMVVALMSGLAARRALPPPHDVSELARAPTLKPNQRVPVELRGWVAAHPQRGDFGIEFPFQCEIAVLFPAKQYSQSARNGRVWVRAPLDADVAAGDAVSLHAELAELPSASNPGEREHRSRYLLNGCWCVAAVKDANDIRRLHSTNRYFVARLVAAARRGVLKHYETAFANEHRAYPANTAQLLTAMVFGEGGLRDPLPGQTRGEFRAAGLSHVLVASGTQISMLAILLLGGAHWLGLRRWPLVVLVVPVLVFYALMAGGAASIWRATIGGALLATALVLGRDIDGLSLWSLALIALLAIDPSGVFDLSLQLSFAATWGLIALSTPIRATLQRGFGRNALIDLASLTLGAQAAILPILLFHFGRVSASSLGANLLGVPLAGALVATGLAGLVAPFIAPINYALTTGIAGVAAWAAKMPGAQFETPPLQIQWALLCYGLLLLAAAAPGEGQASWRENLDALREETARWWKRRRAMAQENGESWQRPQSWIVALALLLTVWAAWHTYLLARPDELLIAVLDVGQGEAIVIRAPSGRTVLIDGGTVLAPDRGDVGRSVIAPYLASLGVRKIDALVITHSDADHLNGLPFVLRELPVGLVIDGAARRSTASPGNDTAADDYFALRQQIRERRIPNHAATPGQTLNLGGGAVLRVLAPVEPLLEGVNNNAAVVRLEYGYVSALFTGDIEKDAEERLVRRGLISPCTILKIPHHGSKTSTSPLFLKATRPKATVISAGRYNGFGHPSVGTINRLAAARIPTFRTDRQGAVEFRCDQNECWAQTYK